MIHISNFHNGWGLRSALLRSACTVCHCGTFWVVLWISNIMVLDEIIIDFEAHRSPEHIYKFNSAIASCVATRQESYRCVAITLDF